jgi:hypothetical protein
MGVPDQMIIQDPEALVTELLVKRPGLELECIEPGVFASAYTGFGFSGPHQLHSAPAPAILRVNRESPYKKPARQNSADQPALDLTDVGPQENVNRLRSIKECAWLRS